MAQCAGACEQSIYEITLHQYGPLLESLHGGGGTVGLVRTCVLFCLLCAYVWTANGFLHCRCNNLRREGEGGGSSITISTPPSVSLAAK